MRKVPEGEMQERRIRHQGIRGRDEGVTHRRKHCIGKLKLMREAPARERTK